MTDADLVAFATELRQEVIDRAEEEGAERLQSSAFTEVMIEYLTDAGEVDDGVACFHQALGVAVNGYSLSGDDEILDLFINVHTQAVPPGSVPKRDVDTAFHRLHTYLERALDGYHLRLEEASEAFDMTQTVHAMRERLDRVRLFVLTDGIVAPAVRDDTVVRDLPVSHHVWDIVRLHRCVTSGRQREPIEIDFLERFGAPLPCLSVAEATEDYAAFMTIIPGQVLNEIYAQYGPRLLELNVRSFLQARGKINQGIRRTILDQPERFLAYNNGISATASRVQLMDLPNGGQGIRAVSDLQIVNGGQTTASIHQAARKDHADVSRIRVQAKLTVINPDEIGEVVPLISRYANSQNKVNEADFSANDPFHVTMEKLSRTVWAPAVDGTQRQTKWFYERARGQYQDAVAREGTPARQRQWRVVHPPQQRFTKTDLAKFENTWEQLPHLVSLGAEKNFREFTLRLAKRRGYEVDQTYFQRLIAKAILFRRAERIVSERAFGGYRANIVTYTIARLCQATAQRLDLDLIWQQQAISGALEEAIWSASEFVHAVLTDPPGGRNVTEWCKRSECWERVLATSISLPHAVAAELVSVGRVAADRGIEGPDPAERAVIEEIKAVTADTWLQISRWAAQTSNLEGWQRRIAYSLGLLARQGRAPSRKQAEQGRQIVAEAARLGFVERASD